MLHLFDETLLEEAARRPKIASMIHGTVLLYANERDRARLQAYEAGVMPIVRQHGGSLIAAYTPEPALSSHPVPDEIHILSFPSQAALASYRSDSRLKAFEGKRTAAIAHTEIYVAESEVSYP